MSSLSNRQTGAAVGAKRTPDSYLYAAFCEILCMHQLILCFWAQLMEVAGLNTNDTVALLRGAYHNGEATAATYTKDCTSGDSVEELGLVTADHTLDYLPLDEDGEEERGSAEGPGSEEDDENGDAFGPGSGEAVNSAVEGRLATNVVKAGTA